jgi:putative ABC transport system substrate-binding protein
MRRRDLIRGLAGAIALPLAARAQQKALPVVAFLSPGEPAGREKFLAAFRQGLAEAGYIDGKNIVLSFYWVGDDYGRLDNLAADLVRSQVALVVAPTLPSVMAAGRAGGTIPIVFMVGVDPVRQGLVASLSKPGSNLTGLSMLTAGLDAKRLQLLGELTPHAMKIGFLINPGNANAETQIAEVRRAASSISRDVEVAAASNVAQLATAFAGLARSRTGALLVGADPFFTNHRQQIVDLARQYRLPAIYEWRDFVEAGGLASYGSSLADNHRKIGVYAGKILAGAKPADLPVMQPTRFELVINLKTAKALGLVVPQSIFARADEAIE